MRKLIDDCKPPSPDLDYVELDGVCKGTYVTISDAKIHVHTINNPTTDDTADDQSEDDEGILHGFPYYYLSNKYFLSVWWNDCRTNVISI